ncbi:hypothetical protein A8924_3201 [Saccharopolyspora erythraea NRRL 2338]|uniref:Uncharacterized protein n=2 Tax=Saccharopolyspora erythraea TaxID=1836 RepID=A4FDG5_SACEN|nr:hypothetical protein [Saccharopolyspora erythraea]EQD82556.1 hypothetical protein N599_30095 [Saccharopolyspora erythraea D]PFG95829.1 hypothetical protein A8924_3201 [Saccharopolyspora erythraea NRRL 2338]QRK92409.1 hypothetical protein JQX30_14485 [Saccharopolyspora erythraea]CAM02090.1 hypothetical protein SACE_2811 [Saccharopolyspora erythraea NRRL 2338]
MRIYAERHLQAARQVVFDLLAIAWIAGGIWWAFALRDSVLELGAPGRKLIDAGANLERTFGRASASADQVPFVGAELAGALDLGTDAGKVVAEAGHNQVEAVAWAAGAAAAGVVAVVLLVALPFWLLPRVRYARAATVAVNMRTAAPDLLALRALTELPPSRLMEVSADPAAAWRDNDREIIEQLASLRLGALGLRPITSGRRLRTGAV